MKGILKIYHPEETLKYNIKSSYCKALYSNKENLLEVEITTDDDLDQVEDDSLQYNFPQISLSISDFPINGNRLAGNTYQVNDTEDQIYCDVNLFNDDDAYLDSNELSFTKNKEGVLEVIWAGQISDFYTNSEEMIPFKLKCNFKEEKIEVED